MSRLTCFVVLSCLVLQAASVAMPLTSSASGSSGTILTASPVFRTVFGDSKIEGITPAVGPPAYSESEILGEVATLFGQGTADQIASSGKGYVEIWSPNHDGAHDKDTIGLNTKDQEGNTTMSLQQAAIVTVHEHTHSENAEAAGTDKDPTTVGPAGACNHAQMHYDQVVQLLEHACDDLNNGPPAQKIAVCTAIENSIDIGDQHASNCTPPAGSARPDSTAAQAAFEACCSI